MIMNIFKKAKEWNNELDANLGLEEEVKNIDGMREAKAIQDPIRRLQTMMDLELVETQRNKWMIYLIFQDAYRTAKISMGVLALSCVMDGLIILHMTGVF